MKCVRPDRIVHSLRNYVAKVVGAELLESPLPDFRQIAARSSPARPIIVVAAPPLDPSHAIESLSNDCVVLSLQNSPGEVSVDTESYINAAIQCIRFIWSQATLCCARQCFSSGQWLVIRDCSFDLKTIKRIKNELLAANSVHLGFRLWLIATETIHFPVDLYQSSVRGKLAYENC